MTDTYYDSLCEAVKIILSRHVRNILGSRRVRETEQEVKRMMDDLEYTFKDYGVDWKLGNIEGSKK